MIDLTTPAGTPVIVRLANNVERSTKTQCKPYPMIVARGERVWYVRAYGLHGGYPLDRVRLDEETKMKSTDDANLRRALAVSAQDALGIAAAILECEASTGWDDVPSRAQWIRNAIGRATRGDAGPARAAHEALSRAALGSVRTPEDVEAYLAGLSLGAAVAVMRGAK